MDLELIEKRREPGEDGFGWQPFDRSEWFNPDWWNDPLLVDDASIYLQVRLDGVEVARVELDELVDFSHFTSAPQFESALEIEFIEVVSTHRRRGIGRAVVNGVIGRYPGRRFVAFSEGADPFWASLGWDRYEHPEGVDYWRPLYIQPA
ncbi:GNAT family N-acetyltransferase [Jiangella anatolica]|uniref:GNAT family N-acetyltransferase n=1 Tax=Jiangella anatolica TaxID=2670374 RepID=A0A2W2BES7_9ACTN|nr:GNAT family N-acetyltransferase [Jiangella anatolica]PZF86111.1 GNAT family N-acetyltransferase [Jiangella anatolica]